ncbi:MAG: hypothetical protein ACE5GZ_02465 [Gammaproteobacteria bacterium]
MKQNRAGSTSIDNENNSSLIAYLRTLFHNGNDNGTQQAAGEISETVRFDGFGIKHASLLLRHKK